MDKASFTNRRGFLKTVAIGAGGYALGSLLIQPKSAYPQSIEGNLEKIPIETRWAFTSGGFVYYQISDDKALFDKVGQERYNEIKRKNGLASGARNKKHAENFGFTGNDAKSVAGMATALVTMYYHFNFYKRRKFKTCPRKNLPESIRDYPQFTAQRYKKCAVMFRAL